MNVDTDGHIQPPGDNIITQNETDTVIKDNNRNNNSDIPGHGCVQNPSNTGNGLRSSDTWQIPKMHARKMDKFLLKKSGPWNCCEHQSEGTYSTFKYTLHLSSGWRNYRS